MMLNRNACCTRTSALLFVAGILIASAPSPVSAQADKPTATDNRAGTVDASQLPKAKQTTLGLYVTAAQAYEMWKASPDKVKVIDVRTPEEFAFVGHPEMAWNIPVAFVSYQRKDGKFEYKAEPNKAFVDLVKEIAAADRCSVGHMPVGRPQRDGRESTGGRRVHEGLQHRRRSGRRPRAGSGECLSRKANEERLEELGSVGLQH